METIFTDEINVGTRIREEFKNIDKLAESINKYGLFHPIVIDNKKNLIAGERRVRAFQLLGRKEIPAKIYKDLTENERRLMELEENIQREDLTPYERSKNIVELVEVTKEIVKEEQEEFLTESVKNSNGELKTGRPQKIDSDAKIAERTGIPRTTIVDAKQHVEAVKKYPEISGTLGTKPATTIAKNLENLPEPERQEKLEKLEQKDPETIKELSKPPQRKIVPDPEFQNHEQAEVDEVVIEQESAIPKPEIPPADTLSADGKDEFTKLAAKHGRIFDHLLAEYARLLENACTEFTAAGFVFDDFAKNIVDFNRGAYEKTMRQLETDAGLLKIMRRCPKCEGKKCGRCREKGYVTKSSYEIMQGGK